MAQCVNFPHGRIVSSGTISELLTQTAFCLEMNMQPKRIPHYLGNTFSILSYAFQQQILLKICEIVDIVRSNNFQMAKRMTVQEVLDEIVADQDSGNSDFDDESGDFFYRKFFCFDTHISCTCT